MIYYRIESYHLLYLGYLWLLTQMIYYRIERARTLPATSWDSDRRMIYYRIESASKLYDLSINSTTWWSTIELKVWRNQPAGRLWFWRWSTIELKVTKIGKGGFKLNAQMIYYRIESTLNRNCSSDCDCCWMIYYRIESFKGPLLSKPLKLLMIYYRIESRALV